MAKADPILVADGVRRAFGGLIAVDVEHAEVATGRITALIGPNGAGKTTFFNLMTGFDEPDQGHWTFDGTSIEGMQPYKVARLGMVRTFQLTKVLARLSVIENMRLGATRSERRADLDGALEAASGARQEQRHHRSGRRPARALQARSHARRVRRQPVGRSTQAARDGAGADDRPEADHARRADGRREPGAQAEPARAHQVVEGRGAHACCSSSTTWTWSTRSATGCS